MRRVAFLALLAVATALLALEGGRATTPNVEAHLGSQINTHRGFDRCGAMSTADLDAFWNGTPLWTVGIYIGGETAQDGGCFLPDGAWVTTVRTRGWGIVFIWDGLQAPCTSKTYRMSSNTTTAYDQGVDAANRAFAG